MQNWFWNRQQQRLRAGWRIAIFALLFIAFSIGGQIALRALLGGFPKGSPLIFPVLAISATAAVLICRRFLDRASFASLGLAWSRVAAKDLAVGFTLSGLMAGTFVILAIGMGLIGDFRPNPAVIEIIASAMLTALMTTILVGYWEELVMRGYVLQNMADGLGLRLAVLFSCVIYGLLHAANPHASLLSSAIIVLFGYLRIYGYLTTGELWLSIGMHVGWNFFQASVFGFAASGQQEEETLFVHSSTGPDWLTGGNFGPEASILIIPVLCAGLLLMRAWSNSGLRRSGAKETPQGSEYGYWANDA